MCTSNRDDRKLENTVKESRFKHLGELHKEWTEAGVSALRVTTLRCLQEKGYQALLKQKHRQKHLTWAKEKKNWTFGNQGPRVWRKSGEAQNTCCLKSSVKFPQSVMIWAAMSSAGVGPLCFLKSTVNAAILQEILEHFMLPSADKLYGYADLSFQQDLAPAYTAKATKSWWPWCYCAWLASKLAWPELHWESIGYCQEEDERHQTQQRRWPRHFHTTPHWCSNSCKRRPNQVLSA